MSKLIGCIIAYNEEKLLPQCIESIKNYVDRIIVVEGRIAAFPGNRDHSIDRTVDIARDYGCEVIQRCGAWHDEAEMRSQYLVGQQGDWYIQIDADEVCMTALPKPSDFPAHARSYSVKVQLVTSGQFKHRPRFFKHCGKMKYNGVHDALFSDDVLISNPNDVPVLHSVWFAHYQHEREPERRMQKMVYYKCGYTHEPELRKLWRMTNGDKITV